MRQWPISRRCARRAADWCSATSTPTASLEVTGLLESFDGLGRRHGAGNRSAPASPRPASTPYWPRVRRAPVRARTAAALRTNIFQKVAHDRPDGNHYRAADLRRPGCHRCNQHREIPRPWMTRMIGELLLSRFGAAGGATAPRTSAGEHLDHYRENELCVDGPSYVSNVNWSTSTWPWRNSFAQPVRYFM
jgi:hypothetical protein